MNSKRMLTLFGAAALIAATTPLGTAAICSRRPPRRCWSRAWRVGRGVLVGPGGALFVTEGAAGRISRVDPKTGEVTTFASGLPPFIVGIGGAMDIAFIGSTAYVLVTLVGPDVGGSDVVGIYRVDGPNSFSVIADIGAFSLANPPTTDFFVPTGSSTRWKPSVAGSSSPMDTTTACCASRSMGRSVS